MIELLKVSREKRALRFAKRRLGSHKQAKKKRDIMAEVLRKMRAAASAFAAKRTGTKWVGSQTWC